MTGFKNRLTEKISSGKKLFIPYLTFSYPNLRLFYDLLSVIGDCGADAVEVGIPFSDPVADGPTIQRSSAVALKRGASLKQAFSELKKIKQRSNIPVLFMSYYNPILAMGINKFLELSDSFNLDGVVIPDLPLEEAGNLTKEAEEVNLALALFISPTTSRERIKKIDKECNGFIYYISSTGVTGVKDIFSVQTISRIREVKKLTSNPLCVGFGISKESQVLEIKKVADGVIIGSAIVKIIDRNLQDKNKVIRDVVMFSKKIRKALDG